MNRVFHARILPAYVLALALFAYLLIHAFWVKSALLALLCMVVLVSLTEKGKRAFDHHKRFHDEMIRQVLKGLDGQEQEILRKALLNLMDFFEKRKG